MANPTEKNTKRLTKFKLVRQAVDKVDPRIEFSRDSVPRCCRELCRHFNGNVCGKTGQVPEQTCQPAVSKLVKLAMALDLVLFEDRVGQPQVPMLPSTTPHPGHNG